MVSFIDPKNPTWSSDSRPYEISPESLPVSFPPSQPAQPESGITFFGEYPGPDPDKGKSEPEASSESAPSADSETNDQDVLQADDGGGSKPAIATRVAKRIRNLFGSAKPSTDLDQALENVNQALEDADQALKKVQQTLKEVKQDPKNVNLAPRNVDEAQQRLDRIEALLRAQLN